MGKWNGKSCRLISMLSMTFAYFVVELVMGHVTGSLALVADSFHMLSDVVALIVGLLSVRYSKRGSSRKNTFGWARAEVLGAMVNAVFLIALCFTIFVEAVQRMIEVEEITQPTLLLIVGGIGLLINLIGLALFHNQSHGHSHGGGGHGHSHGGHGHSHGKKKQTDSKLSEFCEQESKRLKDFDVEEMDGDSDNEVDVGPVQQRNGSVRNVTLVKDPKQVSAGQLNMKGVFLHVLGDALGSVIVMISAVIFLVIPKYCDMSMAATTSVCNVTAGDVQNITMLPNVTGNGTCAEENMKYPLAVYYVDPILSLILVVIILSTSIPLVRDSGMILMQTVPTHIVVAKMQSELEQLDGVLAIHEFHVWSLAGDKIVASLHLRLRSLDDYVRVSNEVKEYFHDEGIHSVTIQPEFVDLHVKKPGRECVLECGPEKECHPATCCEVKKKTSPLSSPSSVSGSKPMEAAADATIIQQTVTQEMPQT